VFTTLANVNHPAAGIAALTERQPLTKKTPTVITYNVADLKGEKKDMGGGMHDTWNDILAGQTINSLWIGHSSPEERDKQCVATVAALHGIKPGDELEGMLAAQMLAAHNAAMESFRRAMLPEQTAGGRQDNLNAANKLTRSFATLLDALNKHRGKGQQKVTVEHVHVHNGGQAIVGNVEGAGGGGRTKKENQSHALEYAPGETLLWSENTQREAVPIATNAQWTMPNARRNEPRRS
jgi:hypothetical protein